MRRDEEDRSAHDEMRRSLARYEDVTLLKDLYEEASHRIDLAAGPDRRDEIASLEPRAKIEEASLRLKEARSMLRHAKVRTAEGEARFAEAEQGPIRARLPGRIGAEARHRAALDRRKADRALQQARQSERQASSDRDSARHRLYDAENAAKELDTLREAQARRWSWMRDNPDEVRWAHDLGERIDARSLEGVTLATRREARIETGHGPGDGRSSRLPRARQPDGASLEPRDVYPMRRRALDPATEAVLQAIEENPERAVATSIVEARRTGA